MLKSIKKYTTGHLYWIVSIFFVLTGCSTDALDVDVSNVDVAISVDRMEQDLFVLPVANYDQRNHELVTKYGFLYETFLMEMVGEGSPYDPMAGTYLRGFISDTIMREVYKQLDDSFSDFTEYKKQIDEGFKHYKFYFPDSTIPNLYTFYSNFNANVFPFGNHIAIGLDMYLGADSEIVKSLPPAVFPDFIKQKMNPEYLVADVMKAWLMNRFTKNQEEDFLSTIISLGKVMYLMDAMLPNEEDYIKFGCSKEQMDWCVTNEQQIWKTIVKNKILYSKDKGKILQYVNDGPFTKDMPHESPSRVGVWLGWQIVNDYVYYNEVSIDELLTQTSAKLILKSYSQGNRE